MMLWCWPLSHREKVLPIVGFLFFFHILQSTNFLCFKQIHSLELPQGLPLHDCPLAFKTTLRARAALVKLKARQELCQLLCGVEAHDFLDNSRLL